MRCVAVALLTLWVGAAPAAHADDRGTWAYSITPYLMLPSVEATLGYDTSSGAPGAGAADHDWLQLINAVAMLSAEARRERVFVAIDWMYLDMGNVDSVVRSVSFPDGTVPVGASLTLDSDASFDGWTVMVSGGWRVTDSAAADLDVYGGLRTLNLSSSLRWSLTTSISSPGGGATFPAAGMAEARDETWDLVLGARGAWRFADGWQALATADLGRGDGTGSSQWALGVGWQPGATSFELAWRDIAWSGLYAEGRGELRLYGPVASATFHF